jgi:hypothetical protein
MVNSQEGLTLRIYLTSEKEQDIYPDSIIGFYNLTVYILAFAAKLQKNTLEPTGNSEFQGFLFLHIFVG